MLSTTIGAARREFIALRRSLAALVLVDAGLVWSVLLAALVQCHSGEDSVLFAVGLTHIFTVILGAVVVGHARHAYGVLRLLFVFYLLGFVGDLVTIIVRLVMAYGVDSRREPARRRAQLVYAGLAVAMAFVDVVGAYLADQIRERVTTATLPVYAAPAEPERPAPVQPQPLQMMRNGGAANHALMAARTPY